MGRETLEGLVELLLLVLGVQGLGLLLVGVEEFERTRLLERGALRSTGVIVRIRRRWDEEWDVVEYPRTEFRTGDGALVEFEDRLRRQGRIRSLFHKRVGDVVYVLYDPGNPRDAATISSPAPRTGPTLYLTWGGVLLCVGLRIVLEYL